MLKLKFDNLNFVDIKVYYKIEIDIYNILVEDMIFRFKFC